MEFALNLLYLEEEFYLLSSIGKGIDDIYSGLIQGPAPIGAMVANLDIVTHRIIEELAYQVLGNIRANLDENLVDPIQRPQLNLSVQQFSNFINAFAAVAGRAAVLRTLAYQRANVTVSPYRFTVATLTDRLVELANRLGMCRVKDEEREVIRILYGTGNATRPGGLFPNGFEGEITLNIKRRGLN
ncbi:hypothetical protein REPUB_Repub12eG0132500 [Reevesia pubescens]